LLRKFGEEFFTQNFWSRKCWSALRLKFRKISKIWNLKNVKNNESDINWHNFDVDKIERLHEIFGIFWFQRPKFLGSKIVRDVLIILFI
jgi:hypothetical protein